MACPRALVESRQGRSWRERDEGCKSSQKDGRFDFGLAWSFAGPIAGRSCIQIEEPSDPDTWWDHYLCLP